MCDGRGGDESAEDEHGGAGSGDRGTDDGGCDGGDRKDAASDSADVERATRNSLADAGPGAFQIPGPGAGAADGGQSGQQPPRQHQQQMQPMQQPMQQAPPYYTADNLPPNIDIMAEATLVRDEDYRDLYDGEEQDDQYDDRSRDTFGLAWDDNPQLGGVGPDADASVGGVSTIDGLTYGTDNPYKNYNGGRAGSGGEFADDESGPRRGGVVHSATSTVVSPITEANMRLPSAVRSLPDAEVRRHRVARGQRALDDTRNATLGGNSNNEVNISGGEGGLSATTPPTVPVTSAGSDANSGAALINAAAGNRAPCSAPGNNCRAPNNDDSINNDGTMETAPSTVARATKMDNGTVYAFGRTYSAGKIAAAVAMCVIVAVVVPLAVFLPGRNRGGEADGIKVEDGINEAPPPPSTYNWTYDEITAIVSPTLSSPDLLDESDSPQARAVEWLVNGGATYVVPNEPTTPVGDNLMSNEAPVEEVLALEREELGHGRRLIRRRRRLSHGLPAETRIVQRYVLAVLYYSTGGDVKWTSQYNYLSDSIEHECDWGVEMNNGWKSLDCDDDGNVQLINLWTNNLVGTIPDELAELRKLTTVDFLTNSIGGPIPGRLPEMTQLHYLNLGYNRLTGTLSPDLGNLDQLQYFMVDINELTGTIPTELSRLGANLTGWMSLEGNKLTGTVPRSFDRFVNATWLYFNRNRLTGSVEFMCDALRPKMAPDGANGDAGLPLLELWADRDEVECSCCNCCPILDEEGDGGDEDMEGGEAVTEAAAEGGGDGAGVAEGEARGADGEVPASEGGDPLTVEGAATAVERDGLKRRLGRRRRARRA